MRIKIDMEMTGKIMYEFLLRHTYGNIGGIAGIGLGIICLILGAPFLTQGDTQKFLFFFFGVMIVLINPIMLRFKAQKQVKLTPMFQKPIQYEFHEEGVTIRQNEDSSEIIWDNIAKIIETKNTVIIYISRIRAFVITKESMNSNYQEILKLFKDNLEDIRVKVK